MIALTAQQDLSAQSDVSRVEYFAVPTNGAQLPVQVGHYFVVLYFTLHLFLGSTHYLPI